MVRPRYFAVGLKGWVEIRQHTQPLKELKSEAKIKIKETYYDYRDWYNGEPKQRDKIVTLKQTVWQGGKILRTLKTSQFKYRAGFQVGKDKCVEITKSTLRKVLKNGSSSRG